MADEKFDIKKAMDLACKILENTETRYIKTRNLIDKIFTDTTADSSNPEVVFYRLCMIDATYSTNVGGRLYGLSDLSEAIVRIGNDNDVKKEIQNFKKSEVSKLDGLFDRNYGIHKDGTPAGNANSLISKYLYFVNSSKEENKETDYHFPIIDRHVKNNSNTILNYFNISDEITGDDDLQIIKEIIRLCTKNHYSFKKFDNLNWLYGKVTEGSLSSVLSKKTFENIIENFCLKKSEQENQFKDKITDEHERLPENYKSKSSKTSNMLSELLAYKLLNQTEKIESCITQDFYDFLKLAKEIKEENN